MVKPINEYTVEELSLKINAIKAEREKTANALKRYEEELERRKHEIPLGVPRDGEFYVDWKGAVQEDREEEASKVNFNSFNSKESAEKHAEMLLAWRKTLVANSKGEPIDIKVLLPLLKKGWVAYEKEYGWVWFNNKPFILRGTEKDKTWSNEGSFGIIAGFKLKPAENWETSLMECGL